MFRIFKENTVYITVLIRVKTQITDHTNMIKCYSNFKTTTVISNIVLKLRQLSSNVEEYIPLVITLPLDL